MESILLSTWINPNPKINIHFFCALSAREKQNSIVMTMFDKWCKLINMHANQLRIFAVNIIFITTTTYHVLVKFKKKSFLKENIFQSHLKVLFSVKQLSHLLQFLFQPGGGSALLKFLLDLWRAQVKSDLANRGL